MIAAVFIFMFVFGYNQYLWPLIMTTTEEYWTVVMGLKTMYGLNISSFCICYNVDDTPTSNNNFSSKMVYTRNFSK